MKVEPENDLRRKIVSVLKEETDIGGLRLQGLINRLNAAHVHDNLPPPAEEDIREAVFSMIASEHLVLDDDRRLCLPKRKEAPKGSTDQDLDRANHHSSSGILPCGPGDYLYNVYGQRVAVVDDLKKISLDGGKHEILLAVKALFRDFISRDGVSIPGLGEVARPVKRVMIPQPSETVIFRSGDSMYRQGASKKTVK